MYNCIVPHKGKQQKVNKSLNDENLKQTMDQKLITKMILK